MAVGEGIYQNQGACQTCHGPDGQGVQGAFPPLAGAERYLGDCATAAEIVLHGMKGPIQVGGAPYNGVMVPMGASLDDVQVASVLTYVRSSWGNDYGPCLPADVTAVRSDGGR